jgi:general secretion pathway protein A
MVAWLQKQLALSKGGLAPEKEDKFYGPELEQQIKRFQIAMGIMPDGIVGPRTIMRLAALNPNGEPVLYSEKGGR